MTDLPQEEGLLLLGTRVEQRLSQVGARGVQELGAPKASK